MMKDFPLDFSRQSDLADHASDLQWSGHNVAYNEGVK